MASHPASATAVRSTGGAAATATNVPLLPTLNFDHMCVPPRPPGSARRPQSTGASFSIGGAAHFVFSLRQGSAGTTSSRRSTAGASSSRLGSAGSEPHLALSPFAAAGRSGQVAAAVGGGAASSRTASAAAPPIPVPPLRPSEDPQIDGAPLAARRRLSEPHRAEDSSNCVRQPADLLAPLTSDKALNDGAGASGLPPPVPLPHREQRQGTSAGVRNQTTATSNHKGAPATRRDSSSAALAVVTTTASEDAAAAAPSTVSDGSGEGAPRWVNDVARALATQSVRDSMQLAGAGRAPRAKPPLLRSLEDHLARELALVPVGEDGARLRVYREVWRSFIAAFETYAPLLSDIASEFDRTIQKYSIAASTAARLATELEQQRESFAIAASTGDSERLALCEARDALQAQLDAFRAAAAGQEAESHRTVFDAAMQVETMRQEKIADLEKMMTLIRTVRESEHRVRQYQEKCQVMTREMDKAMEVRELLAQSRVQYTELLESHRDTVPRGTFEAVRGDLEARLALAERRNSALRRQCAMRASHNDKLTRVVAQLMKERDRWKGRANPVMMTPRPDWDGLPDDVSEILRPPPLLPTLDSATNNRNANGTNASVAQVGAGGGSSNFRFGSGDPTLEEDEGGLVPMPSGAAAAAAAAVNPLEAEMQEARTAALAAETTTSRVASLVALVEEGRQVAAEQQAELEVLREQITQLTASASTSQASEEQGVVLTLLAAPPSVLLGRTRFAPRFLRFTGAVAPLPMPLGACTAMIHSYYTFLTTVAARQRLSSPSVASMGGSVSPLPPGANALGGSVTAGSGGGGDIGAPLARVVVETSFDTFLASVATSTAEKHALAASLWDALTRLRPHRALCNLFAGILEDVFPLRLLDDAMHVCDTMRNEIVTFAKRQRRRQVRRRDATELVNGFLQYKSATALRELRAALGRESQLDAEVVTASTHGFMAVLLEQSCQEGVTLFLTLSLELTKLAEPMTVGSRGGPGNNNNNEVGTGRSPAVPPVFSSARNAPTRMSLDQGSFAAFPSTAGAPGLPGSPRRPSSIPLTIPAASATLVVNARMAARAVLLEEPATPASVIHDFVLPPPPTPAPAAAEALGGSALQQGLGLSFRGPPAATAAAAAPSVRRAGGPMSVKSVFESIDEALELPLELLLQRLAALPIIRRSGKLKSAAQTASPPAAGPSVGGGGEPSAGATAPDETSSVN